MLSLYEYIALDTSQRAETLWQEGEFMTNLVDGNHAYSLYSLHGFYVEVVLVDNEISEVTPFKLGDRLDKYLRHIDLKLSWNAVRSNL